MTCHLYPFFFLLAFSVDDFSSVFPPSFPVFKRGWQKKGQGSKTTEIYTGLDNYLSSWRRRRRKKKPSTASVIESNKTPETAHSSKKKAERIRQWDQEWVQLSRCCKWLPLVSWLDKSSRSTRKKGATQLQYYLNAKCNCEPTSQYCACTCFKPFITLFHWVFSFSSFHIIGPYNNKQINQSGPVLAALWQLALYFLDDNNDGSKL